MKKILVFSTSTGAGHNQVAGALQSEYRQLGCEVEIVDFLKDANHFLDLLIAGGYNNIAIRANFFYGFLYHGSNNSAVTSPLGFLLRRLLIKRLARIVISSQPDLIITTHALAISTLAEIKRQGLSSAPLVSIITDFDAHHFYVNPRVDAYIAPSRHSRDMLVKFGIEGNRVHVFGIPIRRDFLLTKAASGRNSLFTVLLMGGNAGPRAIHRIVRNLMQVPEALRLQVVCGHNQALKQNLEKAFPVPVPGKELVIMGYSNEIPSLMSSSHLVVTKPGGITISESLAQRCPVIIPYCIAGQEEENVKILAASKVAIRLRSIDEIGPLVSRFIRNPAPLEEISAEMESFTSTYSLDGMLQLGLQLIQDYRYMRDHAQ